MVNDVEAEAYLDEQIELLAKKAGGAFDPASDTDMRRQLVDFIRCLRTIRKLVKIIDTKFNVDSLPRIVTYLQK